MSDKIDLSRVTANGLIDSIRDDLDKLDGKGIHNTPSNYCWGDGYFASSLERKYGVPVATLRRLVGK